MVGRSFRAACLLAMLTACGSPAPGGGAPRLATAAPSPDIAPKLRHAAVRFEVRGRPFPLPVISGTIAGHPVLMLLDTGANSHVIAGWLARKLHLPMRRLGDIGADHVGAPITAYRVD